MKIIFTRAWKLPLMSTLHISFIEILWINKDLLESFISKLQGSSEILAQETPLVSEVKLKMPAVEEDVRDDH